MSNSEEINDEIENIVIDDCIGYYTRSKRRKLDADDDKATSLFFNSERKRKNPIMFLPMEMLKAVFKHISHYELSENVRLVNRRFKTIAEDVLNCAFKQIEKKLSSLILITDISLQCTDDDMEIKCIIKLLNLLEILKVQYSIVEATVWRYIYNDYYKTPKSCIYAGQLIDAHFNFMDKFLHCPDLLYASAVIRDYALPPEVTKIMQMTKSFCVHFDKVVEEPMANCLFCSGCKILDIIDCAKYGQKSVISERTFGNVFMGEYTYFFRNSWFVALPVSVSKEIEWNHVQRMMHMRLRRIVLSHNDMFLQQDQYEREILLRPDPVAGRTRKPGNNVYTGYGDVGKVFFYYGVMNDGAYSQKFNQDDHDEGDVDEDFLVNELNRVNNSDENVFYKIPHLGFKMHINVQCPVSYAPLRFLQSLNDTKLHKLVNKSKASGSTHIRINFDCEGASYPRLPTRYEYEFQPKYL